MTLHSAFVPQVPGHGSVHLCLTQALSLGQSLFKTHSGLHPMYGSPVYSGVQTHLSSKQIAFGPQLHVTTSVLCTVRINGAMKLA